MCRMPEADVETQKKQIMYFIEQKMDAIVVVGS